MPEVSQTLTGYKFTWTDEKIEITVSKIRSHTDGRVTGEVEIVAGSKKHKEPKFTHNFNSSTTRKQLIKTLDEKFPEWKWLDIIDELSRQVQELSQAGEPIQRLWTSEDVTPPEYLLEPILLKGLPTIVFGEKGVTKSTTALVFYIILSLPWYDNALGFTAPKKSVTTVLLDWELPGNIAQWNLKKLVEGMNLGPIELLHRHCSLPLADDIEQIQRYLDEVKAEAIIIDSLGRAAGGELSKDTDSANRFFMSLDKLNMTSLIIGQTSKNENTKSKSVYGSTFFTYYARNIFELCKSETLSDDESSVALFHRYSNLTGLYRPIGLRFNYNGVHTTVEGVPVNYSEYIEKVSIGKQVMELLRGGSFTTSDIMEKLSLKRGTADASLARLKTKKLIIKLPDGKWGLPAKIDF